MLFHVAQAQQETTPTRLTGLGKNCSTIPVALLDQCFPYEESKTFGIEFRLPPTGGRCDDGLIICYLGSLASRTMDNVHSMNGLSVNSELFNVDNAVNNSLAKYCAGKLNVSWHGIKVHTEKSNGKVIMKLSTSLLEEEEQSFEIPGAERQFIIHFGNENEFSAYVTVDGERIDLDVEKAEQYMKTAPKGAHLKDFVGFWTLGLDVLPWMDHEVELHVNRSCSCSMEAWFIRPTDGVPNDPKEPSTGIGGPKAKCIANTTMEVSLNDSLKANHLIRIQMLIDGNALDNSINFAILNAGKSALMTFTISEQNASIQMKGPFKPVAIENAHLPKGNGTRHADFIIALTEYSYGIVMNKKLLGGQEFFPANWWKGLPFKDMTSLRLRGQFLLLTDPLVMPFDMFGQQNYVPQEQKSPYAERIPNLQEGTNVTFRVKLLSIEDSFRISFLHNRIQPSKAGDSSIFYPPWAVNYIRFEDDVQVHAMNITHPPASKQRNFMQINDTKDLVQAGDLITVKLAIKALNDSSSVAINLFHEALKLHNKVGKTVMKVMLNADAIYFSSYKPIKGSNLRPGWKEKEPCFKGKLNKDLNELKIRVIDDGFNVTLNNNDSETCTYKNGLPKWAIQYITVEYNDVKLSNPPSITSVAAPLGATAAEQVEAAVAEQGKMARVEQVETFCS
uniref:Galectin domain-containing protein n=1 Tax=Globodera pallida TaxID=36090 RepID=A0A183C283_GLOPA